MRDGRRTFPVARAASGILGHPVSVLQAPPGMDAVGVIAAAAAEQDLAPVVLVSADGPDLDLAGLLARELDLVASDRTAVLVLTRTGPWSLREQTLAQQVARGRQGRSVVLVTGTELAFPVTPGGVLFSGRDLILDRGDLAAFAAGRGIDTDDVTIDRLHELTGGWPGLVQIAVDAMQEWPVPAAAGLEVAEPAVRYEVRRRLLPWLPPSWRPTAAHLAVAGSATASELAAGASAGLGGPHVGPVGPDGADGADSADGGTDAGTVPIATLVRHGVVLPHDGGSRLTLLAPLARALLDDLTARSPADLAELRRRVSDLRQRLGEGDCGLSIAVELQDAGRTARILAENLPTLLAGTSGRSLRRALATLPDASFRAHPILLRQAEMLGVSPPRQPAAAATAQGRPSPGQPSTLPPGRVLEEGCLVSAAHRRRGDLQLALRLIDDVDPVAYRTDVERPGADRVPLWHLNAGFARLLAGDDVGAARSLQAGWALRGHAPAPYAHALAIQLALRHALRGEHPAASHWEQEAARHPRPVADSLLDVRALSDLPGALRAVDGLDPLPGSGSATLDHHDQRWVFQARVLAMAALNEHRVADALLHLTVPEGTVAPGLHRALLAPARADAHLAGGHGNQARVELDTLPADAVAARVLRARLHLLTGDHQAALAETSAVVRDQTLALRASLELGLLHAGALLESGDDQAAAASARDVVLRARAQGHSRVLLTVPSRTARALAPLVDGLDAELDELYERQGGPIYPESVVLVRLTERETAVLRGLRAGERIEDLASTLHVSRNTVKSQLRTLYAKLGVHSREEAVRFAQLHRLLG